MTMRLTDAKGRMARLWTRAPRSVEASAVVLEMHLSIVDAASQYEVVVQDRREFASLHTELEALAANSVEPNVFYEPWMLAAALQCLKSDDLMMVTVRHRVHGITGLFPFQLERKFRGLPLRALKSWRHRYCFLCTPLVSKSHGRETLHALFEWAGARDAPCNIIEFDLIASDGAFCDLLMAELRAQDSWVSRVMPHDRAVFDCKQSPGTGVSGKHLKEFRRLQRRLSEQGECIYRVMQDDEPVEPWIDRFLTLEASGWKGRELTAVASDEPSRLFITKVAADAARRKQLQMMVLEINGEAIAMKCNFIANDTAFAFKIAYDERYAKFSPGVLLELFNMRYLKENCPHISLMDSCAMPQHFMINRLWTGRRAIATCLLANRGLAAFMIRHWGRYRQMRHLLGKWREREDSHDA